MNIASQYPDTAREGGAFLRILIAASIVLFAAWVGCAPTSSLNSQRPDETPKHVMTEKLRSLSSSGHGQPIDCGTTKMNKAEEGPSLCADLAFSSHKPFFVLYVGAANFFFQSAYGLAGDADGNVYQLEFDSRALLHLSKGRNAEVFDSNRVRVTTCVKPIRLAKTEEGMLACVRPVNEEESARAAQLKPIETTVCAILEDPAAFNNKLVRVHGYASGNFEYSDLGADGCSDSMWFVYGNGGAPPGLVAYVNGGARPGAEDADGRVILPIPVKIVQDANFRRFQQLMKARAKADKASIKKDDKTFAMTQHHVSATFIGRVDGVSNGIHEFHRRRKAMDNADYLGFGQMGLYDAQFVLQAVEADAVLEAPPERVVPLPSSAN